VHEREPRLVGDRVVAPDLRHRYVVLGTEPPRDVDGGSGHIQMKCDARAAEMRPLRHRLEVIHGFRAFDFDNAFEALALACRCQHEIRKHLARTDPHACGLIFSNVCGYVVFPLELRVKKPDDPVVLELLTDRPNQNWTQVPSGEPVMVTHV